MLRLDGSIQSANLGNNFDNLDYRLYRCQVTKVVYVDNPLNITANSKNPQVLYECIVVGGESDGFILSNVRDFTRRFGSANNYEERILEVSPKNMNVQSPDSVEPKDQPGSMVLVGFVDGNYNLPVILGLENSPLDAHKTGAAVADGPRWIYGYNGIAWVYDNNGDLTITRQGGTLDTAASVFTPTEDGNAATIKLTGNQILLNVKNEAITVVVDGDTDSVTVKTAGGAEINLKGGTVAIGSSSTELLDQISKTLDKIATWAGSVGATHTHIGDLGFPVSAPIQASGYTQLQTDLSAIKGLIDGIKGTL